MLLQVLGFVVVSPLATCIVCLNFLHCLAMINQKKCVHMKINTVVHCCSSGFPRDCKLWEVCHVMRPKHFPVVLQADFTPLKSSYLHVTNHDCEKVVQNVIVLF